MRPEQSQSHRSKRMTLLRSEGVDRFAVYASQVILTYHRDFLSEA
jgi:hypothetical protein